MTLRKLKYFFYLVFIAALIQGCGEAKNARLNSQSGNGSGVRSNSVAATSAACGANYSAGWVYDASLDKNNLEASSASFRQQVVDFVNVSLAEGDLGEISGVYGAATGVRIDLNVQLNRQGQLVSSTASYLQLDINDSFVGQTDDSGATIEPYQITFGAPISASNSNGNIKIVFKDNYGQVSLDGSIQGQNFQGVISFVNTVSIDGNPRSGKLGEFTLPKCAIVIK